jgi:hypothetical protein
MRYRHIHSILYIFLLLLYQVIICCLYILIFCILLLLRSMIAIISPALTICKIHYIWYILLLLLWQLTLMSSMVVIWSSNRCSKHWIRYSYSNYLILYRLLFALIYLHWQIFIYLLRHTHFPSLWLICRIHLKEARIHFNNIICSIISWIIRLRSGSSLSWDILNSLKLWPIMHSVDLNRRCNWNWCHPCLSWGILWITQLSLLHIIICQSLDYWWCFPLRNCLA